MNGLLITGIWPAASNDRQQVQLAHHTQDRLDIHQLPGLALNPASNAANAVGLLALSLARHDQVNQPLILCFFLLPVSPGIISAAAYFKHFAHGFYAVFSAESLNHTILQFHFVLYKSSIYRPLAEVYYTVGDAVDWFVSPTARRFEGGSDHSPLSDC